jgi:hypothetical protein
MPNRLERSLKNCDRDKLLRSLENLIASGMSEDEVWDVFNQIERWLASTTRFAPDIWEGPEGWYKQFHGFVIEGDAGDTCVARIWRKGGVRKRKGMDVDDPATWKTRPKARE